MTVIVRSLLVVAAWMLHSTALAALVTVTAQVGWSCGTGSGGFEAGCTPDVEAGELQFTYDTTGGDWDPSSASGRFENPLTSFTMSVRQESRADLLFTLAGASRIVFRSTSSTDTALTLYVDVMDQSGALGLGTFALNAFDTGFGYDVNVLPDFNFWRGAGAYIGSGYGVSETDWATGFSAVPTEVAEPPVLLAVLTALAMHGALRSRRSRLRPVPGAAHR